MIEAMIGKAREKLALCKCDSCAAETVFPAIHGTGYSTGTKLRNIHPVLASPRAVHERLAGMGWVIVKGKLRCPHCEGKRRGAEKWIKAAEAEVIAERKAMENVTEIRQPTREQRRDIRAALDLHYDMTAQRYMAGETDLTIAKTVGGGCMPGWVAEERELGYGPDGGNEEIERVAKAIADLDGKVKLSEGRAAAALSDAAIAQKEIIGIKAEIAALSKSIGIIKAAVGPRALRA